MKETRNFVWLAFHRFYHKVFVKVLQWPRLTLAIIIADRHRRVVALSASGRRVFAEVRGRKYLGARDVSADDLLAACRRYRARLAHVFASFPEVQRVVSQLGRPDDGTDTTGFFNIEFSVDLKPDSNGPRE